MSSLPCLSCLSKLCRSSSMSVVLDVLVVLGFLVALSWWSWLCSVSCWQGLGMVLGGNLVRYCGVFECLGEVLEGSWGL